jgi:WD40 repeat protein
MLRRFLFSLAVGAVTLGFSACSGGNRQNGAGDNEENVAKPIGPDLYPAPAGLEEPKETEAPARKKMTDPVVITDCRLSPFEKEEVPSLKDGALEFIGTEIREGEQVPKEKIVEVELGKDLDGRPIKKQFRRLDVGDSVEPKQLLGMLDARKARDDWAIKKGKVLVAEKDRESASKTKDEAYQRFLTQQRLERGGTQAATSREDVRAAELLWRTKTYEFESKRESVLLASLELNQAKTDLDLHEIRSSIPGVIRMIYKRPGEAVKTLEPVIQVFNPNKLRAEGLMDLQYTSRLYDGKRMRPLKAVVEASLPDGPLQVFSGHLQDVTGVAVGRTKAIKFVIASCSDDGTVRLWDRETGKESRIVVLPEHVVGRSIACTGLGAKGNWCVCGCSDGTARVWDLDSKSDEPIHKLEGQHRGSVTSVAFSPDGAYIATGGDDRQICLWEAASGKLRYRFPAGHRGTVTSLQFAPFPKLASASHDNTLRIWKLGEHGAHLERTLENRSGDVTQLGISPDGRRALFDQGKTLHLLSKGLTQGSLQIHSGTAGFTNFALFSPDGNLVATVGGSEGRLQFWRVPDAAHTRGSEIRQLGSEKGPAPKYAAFAPDNSFLITGGNRQLFVWKVPAKQDCDQEITAEVCLVEQFVESSSGQVRVWAELKNSDGRLNPNSTVNLVIDPD